MNENPISFSRQFKPPGLAGATVAPANVAEQDLPPGAPPYAGGPLANPPPKPTPAPPQQSLTTLANGGTNHQEAWMSGQGSPMSLPKQAPFGSLSAMAPRIDVTPKPDGIDPASIAHFQWSSGFDQGQG